MKSSSVKLVQLMAGADSKAKVIEHIDSKPGIKMTALVWMSRMGCFADASNTGQIRLRDIAKDGECFMQLNCEFTESVSMLSYSRQKNILFAASRDGQFRVWKIASVWRPKMA